MTPPMRRYRIPANPGPFDLLEQILRDRPNLTGAACIGRWELYDRAADRDPAATAEATSLCRACPQRHRCPESLAYPKVIDR